ncbi:MAG: hypothetical protein ABIB04_04515, partial [Patescibacteria group bacterium]
EKLLLLNSRYAKMTDEGLYEFLAEHSVDLFGIKDDLSLPEIDIDKFITGWSHEGGGDNPPPEDNYSAQFGVIVICDNENHQEQVYNFLTEQGYACKVVNT